MLAGAFLSDPETLAQMSPEATKMWAWHAIEEIEHRDVALGQFGAQLGKLVMRFIGTGVDVHGHAKVQDVVNQVQNGMEFHNS